MPPRRQSMTEHCFYYDDPGPPPLRTALGSATKRELTVCFFFDPPTSIMAQCLQYIRSGTSKPRICLQWTAAVRVIRTWSSRCAPCMQACMQLCMQAYMQACMQACTSACMHTARRRARARAPGCMHIQGGEKARTDQKEDNRSVQGAPP